MNITECLQSDRAATIHLQTLVANRTLDFREWQTQQESFVSFDLLYCDTLGRKIWDETIELKASGPVQPLAKVIALYNLLPIVTIGEDIPYADINYYLSTIRPYLQDMVEQSIQAEPESPIDDEVSF